MLLLSACKKYKVLRSAERDRSLSARELAFLVRHASVCADCARLEYSRPMSAVVNARIHSEGSPAFSINVAARAAQHREERRLAALRPVALGATFAVAAMVVALNLVVSDPGPDMAPAGSEARNGRSMPIEIDRSLDFNLFDTPSRLVQDPEPYDA
jgi:hypothetical protein